MLLRKKKKRWRSIFSGLGGHVTLIYAYMFFTENLDGKKKQMPINDSPLALPSLFQQSTSVDSEELMSEKHDSSKERGARAQTIPDSLGVLKCSRTVRP